MRWESVNIWCESQLFRALTDDIPLISDIKEAHKNRQICSLIGVEGGHALGGSLGVLRTFFSLGVRYMTLTSTCHTPWADSSNADAPKYDVKHGGITNYGKVSWYGSFCSCRWKACFMHNECNYMHFEQSSRNPKIPLNWEEASETEYRWLVDSFRLINLLCLCTSNFGLMDRASNDWLESS